MMQQNMSFPIFKEKVQGNLPSTQKMMKRHPQISLINPNGWDTMKGNKVNNRNISIIQAIRELNALDWISRSEIEISKCSSPSGERLGKYGLLSTSDICVKSAYKRIGKKDWTPSFKQSSLNRFTFLLTLRTKYHSFTKKYSIRSQPLVIERSKKSFINHLCRPR